MFEANVDQFGTNGECPPCKPGQAYKAFPSKMVKGSFCLRLFETDEPQANNSIRGIASVERVNIMIHQGPGMSEGCLLIAGGKKGHRRFERWFKTQLTDDTKITVTVLPYS